MKPINAFLVLAASTALLAGCNAPGSANAPETVEEVETIYYPALMSETSSFHTVYEGNKTNVKTYVRDSDGNVVTVQGDNNYSDTWTFSGYNAGVWSRAESSNGEVITQKVLETDGNGAPLSVKRDNGYTYRMTYYDDGSLHQMFIDVHGIPLASTTYDDAGNMAALETQQFIYELDEKGRAIIGTSGDIEAVEYEYDDLDRVVVARVPMYGIESTFEYEGNSPVPATVTGEGGGYSTYTYESLPASPWRLALAKTKNAVDVVNSPNASTAAGVFENFMANPREAI
jgi:hypothetical protein